MPVASVVMFVVGFWLLCLICVLWMGARQVSRDYDDDQRDGR